MRQFFVVLPYGYSRTMLVTERAAEVPKIMLAGPNGQINSMKDGMNNEQYDGRPLRGLS